MVKRDVTLEEVLSENSKRKCFSWSVPGNPISCKLPKEFEGKEVEFSVLWGISPWYTVTVSLLDATIYDKVNSIIEVSRVQNTEELKKKYPEIFSLKGTFYIM